MNLCSGFRASFLQSHQCLLSGIVRLHLGLVSSSGFVGRSHQDFWCLWDPPWARFLKRLSCIPNSLVGISFPTCFPHTCVFPTYSYKRGGGFCRVGNGGFLAACSTEASLISGVWSISYTVAFVCSTGSAKWTCFDCLFGGPYWELGACLFWRFSCTHFSMFFLKLADTQGSDFLGQSPKRWKHGNSLSHMQGFRHIPSISAALLLH